MKEITKTDLDNLLKDSHDEAEKIREIVNTVLDRLMKSPEAPPVVITDKIRDHLFEGILDMWASNSETITKMPKEVFLFTVKITIMLEIMSIHRGEHDEIE